MLNRFNQEYYEYQITHSRQMSKKKIQGIKLAKQLLTNIAGEIKQIQTQNQLPDHSTSPRLAMILVGNHPASLSYIKRKKRYASKAYIKSRLFHIEVQQSKSPEQLSQQLANTIIKLNKDPKYHGILLQLPLHGKLAEDQDKFLDLIDPRKDVDCLGKVNRQIFQNQGRNAQIKPCVIGAVFQMLQSRNIKTQNKQILIIGKGRLVGNPLYTLLSSQKCNLKIVDNTVPKEQIQKLAKKSDMIFSATGQQDFISESCLKKNCIIIDIGTSPDPQKPGRVRGDFHQKLKKKVCQFYTPVPKGVGPMVVYSLIKNTFIAWKSQLKLGQIKR